MGVDKVFDGAVVADIKTVDATVYMLVGKATVTLAVVSPAGSVALG